MRLTENLIVPLALVLLCVAVAAPAQEPSTSQVIQSRMDVLVSQGSLQIEQVNIRAIRPLPVFYERRNYQPLWTDPDGLEEIRKMIAASANDGLIPED